MSESFWRTVKKKCNLLNLFDIIFILCEQFCKIEENTKIETKIIGLKLNYVVNVNYKCVSNKGNKDLSA